MLYLENAKEYFSSARGSYHRDNLESMFYHRFACMIPDKVDVDTLILAFKIALKDAENRGENTTPFIALIPKYIERGASFEFSHEFREKYIKEILGINQPKLPDVDYGYNEVKKDVIDISNKDRNEVFAALYNASVPIGQGFIQYNPMEWTAEHAKFYFEHFSNETIDKKDFHFKWVLGRPLNCTFVDNLVYVAGYNNDNEQGLAQRVISTCRNIEKINNDYNKLKK